VNFKYKQRYFNVLEFDMRNYLMIMKDILMNATKKYMSNQKKIIWIKYDYGKKIKKNWNRNVKKQLLDKYVNSE
jgi:hypothetical protein